MQVQVLVFSSLKSSFRQYRLSGPQQHPLIWNISKKSTCKKQELPGPWAHITSLEIKNVGAILKFSFKGRYAAFMYPNEVLGDQNSLLIIQLGKHTTQWTKSHCPGPPGDILLVGIPASTSRLCAKRINGSHLQDGLRWNEHIASL